MGSKSLYAIAAVTFLWGGVVPALAGDVTADFIAGTYVIEGRCEKLAKIQAGGDKNVETVPETLTSNGFESWEGSCGFKSVKEKEKGRVWVAQMECFEEAEENEETDTFELDAKDQSIMVTVDDQKTKFVHCDDDKGK